MLQCHMLPFSLTIAVLRLYLILSREGQDVAQWIDALSGL